MNILLSVVLLAGLIYENNCQQLISPSQCWTQWFDIDNPSGTGDWETLSSLKAANPGKICDSPVEIEVTTLSNVPASATGQVFLYNNVNDGFACQNNLPTQSCLDYRVRFRCPSSFCKKEPKLCWTKWYNRDHPSGTGDWETLNSLQEQYPGQICDNPVHIYVVTQNDETPAFLTGQFFYLLSPSQGFVCRNDDQQDDEMCLNYKVRFSCPCITPVKPLISLFQNISP